MASTLPITIKPTYAGTSKSFTTRVLENNFGDGYKQRAGDGINNVIITMDVEWVGTDTNIEELITHFEERAGYQAFTINDTWVDDVDYKWTCHEWTRVHLTNSISTLTATFRQEFDI
jgi:phage-related protein